MITLQELQQFQAAYAKQLEYGHDELLAEAVRLLPVGEPPAYYLGFASALVTACQIIERVGNTPAGGLAIAMLIGRAAALAGAPEEWPELVWGL